MTLSTRRLALIAGTVAMLSLGAQYGVAQQQQQNRRAPMAGAEPMRAPRGYTAMARPGGIDNRPQTMDRPTFNHNFNSGYHYRIGPYHPPVGFDENRRFHYGEILPPAFWAPQYYLGDYWLFGLDQPPVGYEWVRYGDDALLVDTASGEVIQVVYDAFD